MQDLQGKVAFITGGANGIGFGMARAMLAEGMKVVIADWSSSHIAKARDALAGNNAVHFVRTDVSDRANLKAAVDEALDAFGKIHVLCNNAGVNGGGTADDPEFDDFDRVMAVNFGGVLNGTKLVAPIIKAQGEGGHIVCTSSMAGVVPLVGFAAYSASKYAVRGYAESLRMQLAPLGIGVSCLCPGATRTGMLHPPEDEPETDFHEDEANEFMKALWDAARAGIDPLDSGRAVVDAIKHNRFWVLTNREFLEEVKRMNRELEDAFPKEEAPRARAVFEEMRADLAQDLLRTGNRPVVKQADTSGIELGFRSSNAD
ncbi:MAG: SDR family NAD(P)-dependent oxidoreductase [Candidatus Andeanibacterium colombiense]|uniref:SDR family NAD(P)-dependent oxidoreductase n=1 Tax=Candidatus Andeanibacterium colombiense TaxID=3121345 RepID=A0AAJ6BMN7_9SPHN|nr:MAG: SDR family NAD(P)-dependent oxidoreductase [Sphingomonadaceae bacterium]